MRSPRTFRVLVVDGNPACAHTIADLLRLQGYSAAVALSGEDAVRQAAYLAPHVVLLDLAVSLEGGGLTERLQAGGPSKPPFVIAVSGSEGDQGRKLAFAAGV